MQPTSTSNIAVKPRAAVLVAHGSRDAAWAQPFHAIEQHLALVLAPVAIRLAFLDHQQPSAGDAAATLAQEGYAQVDLVPMFLGSGQHAHGDMQALLQGLQQAWPDVQWQLQPALGEMPQFHAAVAELLAQALRP